MLTEKSHLMLSTVTYEVTPLQSKMKEKLLRFLTPSGLSTESYLAI